MDFEVLSTKYVNEWIENFDEHKPYSLGIKTEQESARFVAPVSDFEVLQLIENPENVNTKKNTDWACRNKLGMEYIPELKEMTVIQMNHYLSRFVMDARKKDGTPYHPKTLLNYMI